MTVRMPRLFVLFALAVFLGGCGMSAVNQVAPAPWPTHGWATALPEEVGMDSGTLAQMANHIGQEDLDLNSLLIVRHGYLVTEIYRYPYSEGQTHWVASVTKSVMGALVGIALDQGYLKDVHETLFSLLPDQGVAYLDDNKQAISLEDLLTQTSGLDCHENPAPGEPRMESSANWVGFVENLPMAAPPGTTFNYCTAAAQLLSAALQRVTGETSREFANQNLFAPLGIGPVSETQWPSDPQGVTIGGYGLTLTSRDMAKFGYLLLNHGRWDGQTVVPPDWVATSTESHANQGGSKAYGYLVWVDPQGDWFAALGLAGQHIFVYPAKDLVVVFTADLPFANDQDLLPLEGLLDNYILPAVKSDGPLPANTEAQARLLAQIQALGQPTARLVQPLPPLASQISGKPFRLDDNAAGWRSITFTFESGASESRVDIDGVRWVIGMDNIYRISPEGGAAAQEGLRARWEGQDTLVVDDNWIGQMAHATYRIHFAGDTVDISYHEKFSGSNVELHGHQ